MGKREVTQQKMHRQKGQELLFNKIESSPVWVKYQSVKGEVGRE